MLNWITKFWYRMFLEERPSLCMGIFRMFVAFTTWSHVYPSLVHFQSNYFPGAFKTYNATFFPIEVIQWIQKSPEVLITFFVYLFCIASFTMFIGLLSQLSCILMTLSCYYFYALNAFHVSTLSWDILLVVLFLMCLTNYPSDYFSVDALLRKDLYGYKKKRPYFLQRILQFQIGFIFFYTALYKSTADGNWLKQNPLFYVLSYPSEGVTKTFLLRDFLIDKPDFVYWLGISVVVIEYLMIFLLFHRKTRVGAIYMGIIFCTLLILTLDVPATFFFLFPAQLCLFINPKKIVATIERIRLRNQDRPLGRVFYDGKCGFCRLSFQYLKIMDVFQTIEFIDFNDVKELSKYHSDLTEKKVQDQMQLVDDAGRLYAGFYALRRLARWLPMLWPFLMLAYLPLMGTIGSLFYKWIAHNRMFVSRFFSCQDGCSIKK